MYDYEKLLHIIADEYKQVLGNNLVGIYVHGSISFGCFNPYKSDIDFIVVVEKILNLNHKIKLIQCLLKLEKDAPSKGFEMSVVLAENCKNFVYPTPFELHYSIFHHQNCLDNIEFYCENMNGTDEDLAAHFTVIKEVGYTLIGEPIQEIFGDIPKQYYLDSIQKDVENAGVDVVQNPVYFVLNLCRVYAYKKDSLILSKEQGANWGICNLSEQYASLLKEAMECYRTDKEMLYSEHVADFCKYMKCELNF